MKDKRKLKKYNRAILSSKEDGKKGAKYAIVTR